MITNKTVLSLQAHPDDTEFTCTGTLALLRDKGWQVHSGTMTPGDGGTLTLSREQISKIRRAEAIKSIKMLDGEYHCLEMDDVLIMYDRQSLLKAIGLIRKVRPSIVFAPSPSDYMLDHEIASTLVRGGCFGCGVPNVKTEGAEAFGPVPYLYYVDAVEGKDIYGSKIEPTILVDITAKMDIKEKMLCCHESQRQWLMDYNKMDEYVLSMKRHAENNGKKIKAKYAEGFRQHLGSAYPQDNILKLILGDLVHEIK